MATTIDVLFERLKLTFDEIVKRSGLEERRVEAILCGRWLPSPTERKLIAGAFGVPIDEIEWGHSISPRNVRYHRFGLKEDFS